MMPSRDAWSNPSQVSREDARRMAAFLEDRALCPDQRQVNDWLIATLDPRPGERILEAGSGSGVLARMIAPRVAPGGAVIGIDVSPDMIFATREYLAADPTGAVEFMVASAEAMPFPDGAFDAAFAARLLLHVPDATAVLEQLIRVTRPRGASS